MLVTQFTSPVRTNAAFMPETNVCSGFGPLKGLLLSVTKIPNLSSLVLYIQHSGSDSTVSKADYVNHRF